MVGHPASMKIGFEHVVFCLTVQLFEGHIMFWIVPFPNLYVEARSLAWLCLGIETFKMQIRLNEVIKVRVSSNSTSVVIRNGRDKACVRTAEWLCEDTSQPSICWKEGFTRNQSCRHIELGLSASKTVRKQICVV